MTSLFLIGLSTQYFYVDIPNELAGGLIQVDTTGGVATQVGDSGTSGRSTNSTVAGGAAAAAGILGACLFGPVLGIAAAGAGLYAATQDGAVGDAARATGSATVTVGTVAYNGTKQLAGKAKEVDDKHDLSGQMARGITNAAQSVEKTFKSMTNSRNNDNGQL
jgi:hypothetical protein